MSNQYEVLSPWAEIDPVPLRGISPRITDLEGKKIGLFANSKGLAHPILSVVEEKFKKRFPTAEISWYVPLQRYGYGLLQTESKNKSVFEDWLKGVDAVVAAVGD